MTWLFLALAFLVIAATALALAGRWQPEGLAEGPPSQSRIGDADEVPRFEVVLRGYRMDQVDAELERLRGLLQEHGSQVGPGAAADAPGEIRAGRPTDVSPADRLRHGESLTASRRQGPPAEAQPPDSVPED